MAKLLIKNNRFFCYFIALSKNLLLSLTQLHFRINVQEQHLPRLLLYIFLASKFIDGVRFTRTQAVNM